MPSGTTLCKWVRTHPDFAEAIAAACDFRDFMWCGEGYHDPAVRQRLGQLSPYPGERRRNG